MAEEVTIIEVPAPYVDSGRTCFPELGDVVLINRSSVVDSLVKAGRARRGRATPGPAAPAGSTVLPRVAWSELTLSQASLQALEQHAPDVDPLTVSQNGLTGWLGGSKRRAKLVWQAIEKFRQGMDEGQDIEEGGDGQ